MALHHEGTKDTKDTKNSDTFLWVFFVSFVPCLFRFLASDACCYWC